jgi:hypothetical protein
MLTSFRKEIQGGDVGGLRRLLLIAGVATLVYAIVLSGVAAAARRDTASTRYSVSNPIPPHIQWNHNYGYCGEVSFISAGLYYGQYLSQYDARVIAENDNTPPTLQYNQSSQLLLGVNDTNVAPQMHLTYDEWTPGPQSTASSFLRWVKGKVIRGYPVAIGIYENYYRFYGSTNRNAGDPDYDHIVDATGVTSKHPLTLPATYYPTDVLTFNDNGLWTGGGQQNSFSYPFGSFQATRRQANAKKGHVYSLPDSVPDYAIALTGIADQDHETVPVRVATSVNYESPSIGHHSNTRPTPMALTLTVTVSGLNAGTVYNLYRYDSMGRVPNSAFNAQKSAASQSWTFTATGPTYTLSQPIQSNDEVIYRAVPASAP